MITPIDPYRAPKEFADYIGTTPCDAKTPTVYCCKVHECWFGTPGNAYRAGYAAGQHDDAILQRISDAVCCTNVQELPTKVDDLRIALIELVKRSAIYRDGAYTSGGSATVADAFEALGWSDPYEYLSDACEYGKNGCRELATCFDGERRVCGRHYAEIHPTE